MYNKLPQTITYKGDMNHLKTQLNITYWTKSITACIKISKIEHFFRDTNNKLGKKMLKLDHLGTNKYTKSEILFKKVLVCASKTRQSIPHYSH